MSKILTITTILWALVSSAAIETDVYDVKLYADMPRVYDNMSSIGYRKYQRQQIVGQMYVMYDKNDQITLWFSQFTNKTYKINGDPVTYEVLFDSESLHNFSWCGNNKTGKFTRPNCNFAISMIPSYKIGSEMLDDVHLQISCTKGSKRKISICGQDAIIASLLSGYCAGQIGCNCKAWGHISPTRMWGFFGPNCTVTDIASVNGKVKMKWNKALSRK